MTTPVIIDFQAGGIRDVAQAFRTIEQSVVQLERRLSRSTTETEKLQKKSADASVRADREAAKAKERAAKDLAKGQERLIKEVASESAASYRRREADEKRHTQIQLNSARMATQGLKRELAEREQAERRAMRAREQFAKNVTGSAGRAFSRTMGVVGGAGALLGGFGIADSLQKETRYRGSLANLANSSYQPGDDKAYNRQLHSSSELNDAISPTAIRYGYQKDDASAGLQKFVGKTGDLRMGLDSLEKMAQLARATGSSLEDLADAAGDVFNSDKTMNAEQLMGIMGGIAGQGKLGAVEMKDLASQMAKIQGAATQFSGDRQANIVKMGALTQMARARGGATSAEEAATSTQRFATDLMGMSSAKSGGLNFKTANGTLKDPLEILKMVMGKTGGNASTINDMFGERGVRVAGGFADVYRTAEGQKKGSGMAAMEAEYLKLEKAALTQAQIKEAADKRMAETDMKLEQAMAKLREEVATHLLPKLGQLIPKIMDMIPKFADFLSALANVVEFLTNHPFAGIFAIMAAQVGKDLLAAQMGNAAVAMAAGGLGKNAALAGGAAGAAGWGATAGAAGIGAAIGAAAGYAIVEYVYGKMNASDSRSAALVGGADSESAQAMRLARGGKVTDGDLKSGQERINKIQAEIEEAKGNWFTRGISRGNGWMAKGIGEGDVVDNKERIDAEKMKDLTDSLEKAKAALDAMAASAREAKAQVPADPKLSNPMGGSGRDFVQEPR